EVSVCCSGSVRGATKRFSMVLSVSEILAWILHENFRSGTYLARYFKFPCFTLGFFKLLSMTVAIHSGNFQPSELERKQCAVSQQHI
ncbi:hypothetical protein, partial [Vreelandella arctica]|uniref:hypothetical protein n=1 Tax=Vreelandella arctica TaxID=3126499 RepID=UPI00300DF1EF